MFKWLYAIVALYIVASSYAVFPGSHSIAVDALTTVVVLVTVVYKLCDNLSGLHLIIKGYIYSASYMGYYITQFGRTGNGRYSGGGMVDSPDENGIAAALAPALVLCIYYILREHRYKKLLYIILAAFLANSLVQIGSRGSFLGVIAGGCLFFILMYRAKLQHKNQKAKLAFLVVLGLAAIPIVTDDIFWNRLTSIENNTQLTKSQETGSTRVFYWIAALEMAKDYPFGGGANAFIYYSPLYISEDVDTGATRNRAVHSTWFEVLSEIGYPGFICFIFLILGTFKALWTVVRYAKSTNNIEAMHLSYAIISTLICFVVAMTFLNRIRAEILYWLLLFAFCAYNILYIKAQRDSNNVK